MSKKKNEKWHPGIRMQLTLWYASIFTILIGICCGIFYITIKNALNSSLNNMLEIRTQQIAEGIDFRNNQIVIHDLTGELPAERKEKEKEPDSDDMHPSGHQMDVNSDVIVGILNLKGQPNYTTAAFKELFVPPSNFAEARQGQPREDTVIAHNGALVRLYSLPLIARGQTFGVIQVGEPLEHFSHTMQTITITFLLLLPTMILLSFLGGYLLTRHAFEPIYKLTNVAEAIGDGDLKQRVPVPTARDEIQQLAQVFNTMIERLDESFSQQRRFVADASHELRTPVAAIRSMTDVALSQATRPEDYVEVVREVNAEVERLGTLINGLLALARADDGVVQIEQEEAQLDHLAIDVIESLRPLAEQKGIRLLPGEMAPTVIEGDTSRLIQMLISLVDNAITYNNPGGFVRINVTRQGEMARIIVEDTGIGMTKEEIPHIFERFYRGDPARSRAAGGSGIGLSLVDWIVKAHYGQIRVKSLPGRGSSFMIMLPLTAPKTTRQLHV